MHSSTTELMDLTDKVAIVTGSSRGIGKAIAKCFAENGAKVIVTSRKIDICRNTTSEINELGGEAHPVATHMGNLSDIKNLVAETVSTFGAIAIR